MFNNKQHNLVVTKLFTRGRKLNISLLVIMQYCLQSQKYWWKFYTLFYYEKSKQTQISTNCIIHQILTLEAL